MKVLFDSKLEFRAKDRVKQPTECYLRVLQADNRIVSFVVATELSSNLGQSITNIIETLAAEVVNRFKLHPEFTTFIEHYTPESYSTPGKEERFDKVRFKRWIANDQGEGVRPLYVAEQPMWTHLSKEDFDKLRQEKVG